MKKKKGFTLIELLIVIGIIAVLMAIAIVAINPGRQFAKANNARRWADVNTILNSVSQRVVDARGTWDCPEDDDPIPTASPGLPIGDETTYPDDPVTGAPTGYDICGCLVATYIGAIPVDPTAEGVITPPCTTYDTAYNIWRDATTGRVTVSAPAAQSENGAAPTISVTR